VELMIHSGKTQRQVARELDVSEYSLNLWKKAYLGQMKPAEIAGKMKSPEEMAKIIREQHKEIEYLKRQREILSLARPRLRPAIVSGSLIALGVAQRGSAASLMAGPNFS
jgi:transposase-like protein